MMTLLDKIKDRYLSARKERVGWQVASLSTLIGEIETLAKAGKGEMTDAVVVTVIKKFVKNIDETIKIISGEVAQVALLQSERELYEQFLPKQLTETELNGLIALMIQSGAKDIGDCMKLLKAGHAGQYDGALASRLLKAAFA